MSEQQASNLPRNMEMHSADFKGDIKAALDNENVQESLSFVKVGFIENRRKSMAKLDEFDQLRDEARDIKNHTLDHLDQYLEQFERNVIAHGGQVHWCADGEEARQTILEICKRRNAKMVTKGKSMLTEEIELNQFLIENDIEPVETDLGEYIIQLRGERPSHIIAPAVHVTRDEVEADFRRVHTDLDKDRVITEGVTLVNEARQVLRKRYLEADIGITGANFCIAETGQTVIVTNEGNGDLTQNQPPVHIAVASLEKMVPRLEDCATLLRVLARSATGQEMSSYTTFSSGPKRPGDLDGPEEFHVILLDNGRSDMLGTEFQEMLRCIRCGACMNHCPVYHSIGGHAYGGTYVGPMGSVLDPSLAGVENAGHLANASSFCGRCEEVCPMRIPLPKMMRHWREKEFEAHLGPRAMRRGLNFWAFFAKRPRLYRFGSRWAVRMMGLMGRGKANFGWLPGAKGWTAHRELAVPQGGTFMAQYKGKKRRKS